MMVLRGHRADQARWGPGWTWEDVEPAYVKSEALFPRADLRDRHELTHAFVDAAVAAGLERRGDLNGPDTEGVGFVPVSQRRGRRYSVADGYLRLARGRRNLEVVTGAEAQRVLIEQGRAYGVAFQRAGTAHAAHVRREVILCAGAIGSPHLLLRSGVGPADGLAESNVEVGHELPDVGRNLQDHLATGILVATQRVETLYSAESVANLARWLVRGRGPLTSNIAEAAAFLRSSETLPAPDVELIFAPVLFEDEGLSRPSQHGLTIAAVLLQPRSVGDVRLSSSGDQTVVVDPRYLTDPTGEDIAVLVRGLRRARQIAGMPPLSGYVKDELLPGGGAVSYDELITHIRERSQTLYHPVGTCRLGARGRAVVDAELRVHGLAGLRVVDASVIPVLPRGHTNWPTVMVAERAAQLMMSAP